MGFACDFEGAGFVLKLPVLIISKTKIAKTQENRRTNSPSFKGEWLKAEGVKTLNTSVVGVRSAYPRMALLFCSYVLLSYIKGL